MKHVFFIAVFITASLSGQAQALPIAVNERFDDWTDEALLVEDDEGDGGNIDFLNFSVSNDADYLYLRLEVAEEILLNDDHNIGFQIDTDNNSATGYQINGIGSELGWYFANRQGYFTSSGGSTVTVYHNDIGFMALPTVSGIEFEMAIARDAVINGDPLFPANMVKFFFFDSSSGGDYIPNQGAAYTYTFDETATQAFVPLDLGKQHPDYIRVMTYNTLFDGLIDPARQDKFKRTIQALQPDIITFNEAWDTQSAQVQSLMNTWMPLSEANWTCVEADNGNITCSRWPITDSYRIWPDHRLTANLIDLPEVYGTDLLSVNAHLKCCGGSSNNAERQMEADAFAAFILDAKTAGGNFTIPQNTPIVLSGDMNLVGDRQQLVTLLTGDIQNTGTWGQGGPLDWDGSNLSDQISSHADDAHAYTWADGGSSYWPGRLDYVIYTDAVMDNMYAYTLDTRLMSSDRLAEYGLQADDSNASDHLPKVVDFLPHAYTAVNDKADVQNVFSLQQTGSAYRIYSAHIKGFTLKVFDTQGRLLHTENTDSGELYVKLDALSKGVYLLKVENGKRSQTFKIGR